MEENSTVSYKNYKLKKLKNHEYALAYFQQALSEYQKDWCTEAFLLSIADLAQSKGKGGIGKTAQAVGFTRQRAWRVFKKRSLPQIEFFFKFINALGYTLKVEREVLKTFE